MKKLLSMGCAVMAMGAFAAADDVLISFSTPGQDKYADGRTVLDGECYALVWTKGAQFGGINTDGTCVNKDDAIVLLAPLAKNGKCPPVVFEIDSAVYAKNYTKGKFGVYLLDTRVKTEAGTVALAPIVDGKPQLVNSYASTTTEKAASGQGNALTVGGAIAVDTFREIAAPTIAAMKIDGAVITVKVEGTDPTAAYQVVAGQTVNAVGDATARKVVADVKNGEATFNKSESGTFFKVIGKRNFDAQ